MVEVSKLWMPGPQDSILQHLLHLTPKLDLRVVSENIVQIIVQIKDNLRFTLTQNKKKGVLINCRSLID